MKNKLLLSLVVVNLLLIALPLVVAIPFVRQTPTLLAVAYGAKSAAPAISALSLALAAALLVRSWKAAPALILIGACAVISRVNALEWIFAPAGAAQTTGIAGFHDVRDSDMIIGVAIGGQSRAYPVRYLAHHHMINDTLGPVALLPTY
jgi:hypothetical protein